tara:strand:- start:2599 stop:2958 length:360 start_codon:yes stop_codon:yes gene_type:complete
MSEPQILNLDEVAPPARSVKFQGVSYAIKAMTLAEFIEVSRQADAMKGKEITQSQVAEQARESITRVMPDMPLEVVESLTFEQIAAISSFIQQTADMVAEQGEGGSGKARKKAKVPGKP